jgi:hypothetical protein
MSHFQTFVRLILIITLLLPVASCGAPVTASSPWTADDLRYLDPAGNNDPKVDLKSLGQGPSPSVDILAVYTRTIDADFEIRVDLLDLPITPDYNLLILLDPSPPNADPADWRVEIAILAQGSPTVTTRNPNIDASKIIPRVVRDPWLDTVVVRLNQLYLPKDFKVSVISYLSSAFPPDDYALDIDPGGKHPTARASVLIAFTNTFPAATPAQALRRWDGAHTGPTGERHGLRLILDGVRANDIPVALLDLKTPSSLAALSYLGVLGDLRQISRKGLLILPDVANGEPVDIALNLSRRAAKDFNLHSSPFVTAPDLVSGTHYQFISLPDTTHISLSGTTRLIPIPTADTTPQATTDGPSLEVRRALMNLVFSNNATKLLILGGSLPDSTWGQADRAAPTFAWLAAHPWIHVLDANDLKTFPVGASDQPQAFVVNEDPFLVYLQSAPENAVTDSAWQTYMMLTAPTDDERLHELRLNYLGQVGTLVAASHWTDKPFTQNDCSSDFDHDLQSECILANRNYFAIIETDGARLTHLFYGEHQLVGPTAQFATGLSDPSEWNKLTGDGADPGQIMGAFVDETQPYQQYTASWLAPDTLTLASADGSRVKTFRLTADGLEMTVQASGLALSLSKGQGSTRIPLAVDPQFFFSGPSEYVAAQSADSWIWGPVNGIQVRVWTDAALSVESFTNSLPFLSLPEDPNVEYPPGHYLPFPLSLVTIQSNGNFHVQIGAVK